VGGAGECSFYRKLPRLSRCLRSYLSLRSVLWYSMPNECPQFESVGRAILKCYWTSITVLSCVHLTASQADEALQVMLALTARLHSFHDSWCLSSGSLTASHVR
jgi:hypothetical protein